MSLNDVFNLFSVIISAITLLSLVIGLVRFFWNDCVVNHRLEHLAAVDKLKEGMPTEVRAQIEPEDKSCSFCGIRESKHYSNSQNGKIVRRCPPQDYEYLASLEPAKFRPIIEQEVEKIIGIHPADLPEKTINDIGVFEYIKNE